MSFGARVVLGGGDGEGQGGLLIPQGWALHGEGREQEPQLRPFNYWRSQVVPSTCSSEFHQATQGTGASGLDSNLTRPHRAVIRAAAPPDLT